MAEDDNVERRRKNLLPVYEALDKCIAQLIADEDFILLDELHVTLADKIADVEDAMDRLQLPENRRRPRHRRSA